MVAVFSKGNAGPNPATAGSPAIGPKFISAGASTNNRVFALPLDVTAPATVPITLTNIEAVPGNGPEITTTISATYKHVSTDALGCSSFAAGSLTSMVALI